MAELRWHEATPVGSVTSPWGPDRSIEVRGYRSPGRTPLQAQSSSDVTECAQGGAAMATEQEQLDPQANEQATMRDGFATDYYSKVKTPDQSGIPHHPAAEPTQQTPSHHIHTRESETHEPVQIRL